MHLEDGKNAYQSYLDALSIYARELGMKHRVTRELIHRIAHLKIFLRS